MKSTAQLTAAVALLSGAADAFWRMPCQSRTGLARIDPLVNPGDIAPHAHVIHGGNNFHMETTCDDLLTSDCTSCRVTQDKSAYWTPSLHFLRPDGSSEIVPQIGGMLAYYLLYRNSGEKLEAFPKGFQMLAGDPRQRNFTLSFPDRPKSEWGFHPEETTQQNLALKGLGFNCLNYGKAAEPSMYRHFMPDKGYMDANCPQGLRAEIFFPSCWNGELDSPDHKSHMAYPDTVNGGACPKSHPKRVPSLFYETIWFTPRFAGEAGQFVWSNGDPTGYGYHADFITGWEPDFLQQAVDTCTNDSGKIEDCPIFDIQTEAEASMCTFDMPDVLKGDKCAGSTEGICGNPSVIPGPEYAPPPKKGGSKPQPYPTKPVVVPTLSYATPKSKVTDEYGGGISVYNYKSASTPAAAQPNVTPAPKIEDSHKGDSRIIGTSTYTEGHIVHEVVIVEEDVYVTLAAEEGYGKRHAHKRHN